MPRYGMRLRASHHFRRTTCFLSSFEPCSLRLSRSVVSILTGLVRRVSKGARALH
jgi:hypothetical protein